MPGCALLQPEEDGLERWEGSQARGTPSSARTRWDKYRVAFARHSFEDRRKIGGDIYLFIDVSAYLSGGQHQAVGALL